MKYFFISVFLPLSIVIPIITGTILYRYFSGVEKILFFYLFVNGCCNALVAYLAFNRINNLPLFHIYTVVEFCFLVFFFIKLFNSASISKWLYIVGAVFIFFAGINSIFFQHVYMFNTYSRSVEAIILIALSIFYFKQQIESDSQWGASRYSWFVLGLFIYFSSSLTIFILSNISLGLSKQFDWWMWNVHAIMVLVMYLLFTKGFIACKK